MAYRDPETRNFEFEVWSVYLYSKEQQESLRTIFLNRGWQIVGVTYDPNMKTHHYHLQREKR